VVRIYHRYDLDKVERAGDRISKISPISYYTQTVFYHSPDGGSRGMGLGNLLRPINESINNILNNILNAGTLHSNQSGFIGTTPRGAKNLMGSIKLKLGQWLHMNMPGDDLKKAIVPLPTKEPSNVLFLLMGSLIEAGEKIASVSEIMAGQSPGANTQPTTILALIEQGSKAFSSVYVRYHRGLKSEFKKLYRLNSIYLDEKEYFTVLDNEKAIGKIDYNIEGLDVVPVSNPNEISDTQKMLRAETLKTLLGQGFKDQAIRKRYLEMTAEITGIENVQEFLLTEEDLSRTPPEVQLEMDKQNLEERKFQWSMITGRYKILKDWAAAAKFTAEAEAVEPGRQIDQYRMELDAINKESERMFKTQMQEKTERAKAAQQGAMP